MHLQVLSDYRISYPEHLTQLDASPTHLKQPLSQGEQILFILINPSLQSEQYPFGETWICVSTQVRHWLPNGPVQVLQAKNKKVLIKIIDKLKYWKRYYLNDIISKYY